MDYKAIDYASWPRREMYEFFSAADQPFYNVAFRLDVTRAYNFAKEHSLSFYMVMTYLVTKAIRRSGMQSSTARSCFLTR